MLIGLRRLVALNIVDDMILPGQAGQQSIATDLVEHIVEIIQRIDYLAHEGFLERRYGRITQ